MIPNRFAISLVLFVLIVAPSPSAFAQQPPAQEPPPRVEASAQFALLDTRGNTSAQTLGTAGEIVWRTNPWTYASKATFAQTESGDELDARSLAALFRASRAFDARLSAYGQYDFLRDIFAAIEQRHVIEGGISYLAVNQAPSRLRFDAGLGYLHEQLLDDDLDSATLSLGAGYRLAVSTTSEFAYAPRFLLPMAETGAWKFEQDAALTVAVNTILSLKLSHTIRYAAQPPVDFDTTDTIMAVSLVAKLRRP